MFNKGFFPHDYREKHPLIVEGIVVKFPAG